MHVPPWLLYPLLPVALWPVTLPVLAGLIWLAARFRGRRRWLALAGTAVLVVPPLLEFGFLLVMGAQHEAQRRAEHARTHSMLEQNTALDGVTFPAGTEITWTDGSRTRWSNAELRQPMDFLGLRVRALSPHGTDWQIILAEPQRIGDWNCAAGLGRVTGEGDLLSCDLSDAVVWQGWTLPAQSTVTLHRAERTLDVVLFRPGTIVGQESGRALADPVRLNDDGSPARARFRRDDPLRVADVPLWGDVSWNYDLATFGQGQNRPAVTVAGRTFAPVPLGQDMEGREVETEEVVVTVATGLIARRFTGSR